MFFGWAIRRMFLSDDCRERLHEHLPRFESNQLTGRDLVMMLGGELRASFFSGKTKEFAARYCSRSGRYVLDYVHTVFSDIMSRKPPSMCYVRDSVENQVKVSETLDRRFANWEVFAPAADLLFFGVDVPVNRMFELDLICQTSLLVAAIQLRKTGTFGTFVAFIKQFAKVEVPCNIVYKTRKVPIDSDGNVAIALSYLGEKLRSREIRAVATARPEYSSNTPGCIEGIRVWAQHGESTAYEISVPVRGLLSHCPIFLPAEVKQAPVAGAAGAALASGSPGSPID
jgi:hypothetical protein